MEGTSKRFQPNLPIRIALPAILTIFLFVAAIFSVILPGLEENYLLRKREMIRELTESAWSVLSMFEGRERAGRMTREEAQSQAIAQVRNLRYGPKRKDYFWINDMHPRMVMHPYRLDLEGKDLSNFRDSNDKRLFVAFVDVVHRHGAGYVDYQWQWNDDPGKNVSKLSYVKGFEPWGWVIGSGIYTDDIHTQMAETRQKVFIIAAGILVIVFLLLFHIIRQAMLTDSKRKQAEEWLKISETHLRTLINTIPDLVWLKDPQGVYLSCNPRFESFFGAKEKDIIGKTDYDFVDKDLADFFRMHDKEAMTAEKPSRNEEEIIFAADGHCEIIETIKTPMYGRDGQLAGVLGIGRDITKRKLSGKEREQLMSAIEQSSESIVITDAEGTIRYVNPAFEKVTGYTKAEIIGRNPRILKSGEQDDAFYREMWETISNGKTWRDRIINKKKNGSLFTEDASISPVVDASGTIVNYVSVRRDITEHLRIESEKAQIEEQYHQAQKVESIGRLAGGVSHDLNNLLTPILGFSEMLLEDFDRDDPRKNYVQQIVEAGLGARDLVRQLLAFSRKQPLDYRPVDINKVVADFEKLMRRTIREDIEFKIILSPDTRIVMADIGQIEQVIMNLTVNASDAMPAGGCLTIETGLVDLDENYTATRQDIEPGEYVMLAVTDTGCGMDKETRSNIFEPFFSTKGDLGTGLGLATVYGIIKQHGGSIWVYSELNVGTTFKIYLPVSREEQIEKKNRKKSIGNPSGSETILLVEDNRQVRDFVCAILTRQGYTVIRAENGADALTRLASIAGPVHLLLTDVIMPGMNGKELFARVVEKYPSLKVLYMSGYTDSVIVHEGVLDQGAQLIQKPFTANGLATKVREVLEQD